MQIILFGTHKGGEHTVPHDLNFQSGKYEADHTIVGTNHLYSFFTF